MFLALFTLLLLVAFGQLNSPPMLRRHPLPHDSHAASGYVSIKTINEKQEPGSLNIDVGVRVRAIHGVNLPEQKFDSEGWYWLAWGQEVQDLIERNNVEPREILEIVNSVE